MIRASDFLQVCKNRGFSHFTGTPCSYLKPMINQVIDDEELVFIPAANEGDAVAIASGVWLGGKNAVVIFQNSGLGNAVNPLTSLSDTFRIPILGIVTLRGEPGGPKDEPQHTLMGAITTALLDLMDIPWMYLPQEAGELDEALRTAEESMASRERPFFFVMRKGSVESYKLQSTEAKAGKRGADTAIRSAFTGEPRVNRTTALAAITGRLSPDACFIASTGKTGRELFELGDRDNNFYMVGSMGCALPLGLGLAVDEKERPICIIDGDGALMMRMGAMTTAGLLQPGNLVHVLLDNGIHDSTGGQSTGSEKIRFAELARACGYENILETDNLAELEAFLAEAPRTGRLAFAHFLIAPGSPEGLGRPTITPEEVARRFRDNVSNPLVHVRTN